MKKIIASFIAVSMIMALLTGGFVSVPKASAKTTYTVTFDSNGGSYTPAPIKGIAYGATITLPKAPTKVGRTFSGWSFFSGKKTSHGDFINTTFDATTKVTANRLVVAGYIVLGSSLSLEQQDAPNSITVTEFSSPTNSPVFNFTTTGAGLPATFSLKNQTRSFKGLVPGLYTITMKLVPGYVTNSLPGDTGASFTGGSNNLWVKNNPDGSITMNYILPAGGSISIFFNNRILHTVTFDSKGGTTSPAPKTIAYGGTISLPSAPTKAGFTFKGWATKADGTGTNFTSTTKVIADITVYATYIPIPIYTVTFDAQGGTPTPVPTTTMAGTTITLPEAPTKADFSFTNWNTKADGTGTTFTATTKVKANITVYASYVGTVTIFVYRQPFFLGYPNGTFKPERKVSQAEIAGALTQGPGLSVPMEGKVVSFEVVYFKGIIFTAPFLFVLKANNSPVTGARQGLIGEQGQIATPPLAATRLEVEKCYLPTLLFNKVIVALRGLK
jgi:uncharacterized repeat protein (TIGR02543 family)